MPDESSYNRAFAGNLYLDHIQDMANPRLKTNRRLWLVFAILFFIGLLFIPTDINKAPHLGSAFFGVLELLLPGFHGFFHPKEVAATLLDIAVLLAAAVVLAWAAQAVVVTYIWILHSAHQDDKSDNDA